MLLRHLIEGGIFFMLPIYLMWIVVIILTIRFILLLKKDNKDLRLKRTNDSILFTGSFAFLFGLFGQIIGLFGAMEAIYSAGDISPALMAAGFMISLLTVIYGFALLLLSSIVWFIFKNLIKK
ncbi:MAG: MotA/TolQ/ExbB proton channel family protein [Bacteroidales bacterium]